MKIKKGKLVLASILAIVQVLGTTNVVFAAENSVVYDGDSNKLTVGVGDKDLFDDMKDMMPGDQASSDIKISNNSDFIVTYYIVAKLPEEAELPETKDGKDLLNKLITESKLTVMVDGQEEPFYEGPTSGNPKDAADPSEVKNSMWIDAPGITQYGIKLCTLEAGTSTNIKATVSLPLSWDNEYMNKYGQVDWKFVCVREETSTPSPTVAPSSTPTDDQTTPEPTRSAYIISDDDSSETLAKTGITTQSMIQVAGLFAIVAIGLIAMEAIKRKKNAK